MCKGNIVKADTHTHTHTHKFTIIFQARTQQQALQVLEK